ncbi:Chromodomain-helicase-DNA-binding protein 1-like [Saguinus oedipus]|uniref:Chromodomain-helicase-DNA-binding protein 1-like n=1 Tax=Saguinus oedipus TaxID=9490 RepID=A0ABQ9TH88_SAGOE|nr:Chromodomain-helicase-DNA-binding protein 1-like [Saguinus oedipus]
MSGWSSNAGSFQLALIVAQHRDRSNVLSGIKMAALEDGLKKIFLAAKKKKASVHLPRIGHATKGFNWYGTERLIRKHLAARGIPTYMYPFVISTKQACCPSFTVVIFLLKSAGALTYGPASDPVFSNQLIDIYSELPQ